MWGYFTAEIITAKKSGLKRDVMGMKPAAGHTMEIMIESIESYIIIRTNV
jgi:hypothetical protein